MLKILLTLFSLVGLLLPAALVIAQARAGWLQALLAYLAATLLSLAVGGAGLALEWGLLYGPVGLLLAFALRRGGSVVRVFLSAFLPPLLVGVVLIAAFWVGSDASGGGDDAISGEFQSWFGFAERLNGEAESATETDLAEQRAQIEQITRRFVMVFPAMMTTYLALVVLLNLLFVKEYLAARQTPPPFADLTGWKAPEWLIWPVIVLGFGTVLARGSWLFRPALNLMIVSLIPFLFQGLAIASHFMKRFGIPRWLRVGLWIMGAQLWFFVLVPMGLFDVWIDFRKRRIGPGGDSGKGREGDAGG